MLNPDWKRITINVEPELKRLAERMAKKRRQSVSAYLASLLENDVRSEGVAEEQEPYGKQVPSDNSAPKPQSRKKAG